MSGIRVLQVIGSLNNGGSQAMILNIYRKIDRSKIQFDFVVDHPNKLYFADEIKELGGKIYFMPTFTGFNIGTVIHAWHGFFKEHPEYKIIHSHVRSYASIYLGIAKKYGITTISHSHSTSYGKGFKAFVKNVLQKRLRYVSDYMFSYSEQAGIRLFGKKAAKSDRHFVIKNAIDAERFVFNSEKRKSVRQSLDIPEDCFVVGNVGRFSKVKNHAFLIEIFKKVAEKKENSALLLVGDGELLDEVKKKAAQNGLEKKVFFTGACRRVPEMLTAMDVLCMPSFCEGLPITLIEAQCSGLTCITSDRVDEASDVTGLVSSLSLSQPPEEWAAALLQFEGKERKDMSDYIKKSGYDIEQTSKWLCGFYSSAAALSNGSFKS